MIGYWVPFGHCVSDHFNFSRKEKEGTKTKNKKEARMVGMRIVEIWPQLAGPIEISDRFYR